MKNVHVQHKNMCQELKKIPMKIISQPNMHNMYYDHTI